MKVIQIQHTGGPEVQGKLKVRVDRTCPLADAAHAHLNLEGRKTSGKLLLEMSES